MKKSLILVTVLICISLFSFFLSGKERGKLKPLYLEEPIRSAESFNDPDEYNRLEPMNEEPKPKLKIAGYFREPEFRPPPRIIKETDPTDEEKQRKLREQKERLRREQLRRERERLRKERELREKRRREEEERIREREARELRKKRAEERKKYLEKLRELRRQRELKRQRERARERKKERLRELKRRKEREREIAREKERKRKESNKRRGSKSRISSSDRKRIAYWGSRFYSRRTRYVRINGQRYAIYKDCGYFVRAAYWKAKGIDLFRESIRTGAGNYRMRSGCILMYHYFKKKKRYTRRTPLLGDIVFFHNTYDRNRNRRWDDWYTHVGLVTSIRRDKTVTFVHSNVGRPKQIKRAYLNQRYSSSYKRSGKIVNTFIRGRYRWERKRDRKQLAGQLTAGFGGL